MNFTERYNLTTDETLIAKVKMATIKRANTVLSSAYAGDGDSYTGLNNSDKLKLAHYEKRFANRVITDVDGNWMRAMMFQVVDNESITAASADGDIEWQVNKSFAKIAKAQSGEL